MHGAAQGHCLDSDFTGCVKEGQDKHFVLLGWRA